METEPTKIRVVIADDHPIVRDGLAQTPLSLEDDFDVVGEAATGGSCSRRSTRLMPDVMLLDLRMPNLDGWRRCRRCSTPTSARVSSS